MSEETKEMDELEEADKSTAKIVKHEVGDDEQGDPDMDKGVKKASDNKTKGKAESKKVKEDDEEEEEPESDEDEGEEEEEQTKKEAREVPKLKSEILAGLVDHLKGLKKEDLSKIYGSQIIGEQDDDEDDDEEEEDPEESKKVKESIDQKIEDLDVSQDVEALVD